MFADKDDLIPGLEMTDIVARPIAEKTWKPETNPVRWDPIKNKFYGGFDIRPRN